MISEIVCTHGAKDRLVAVDTSSPFPLDLKPLQTIGYSRSLSVESILALKPTLILLDADAGPPHLLAKLRSLEVFDTDGEVAITLFGYRTDNRAVDPKWAELVECALA